MTKILAVDVDGLLFEDWRAIPNTDPLMPAVAFFKRLTNIESVLLVTVADRDQFAAWATQFGITYTWIINPERLQTSVSAAQSFVGSQHGTLSLYVTGSPSEAREASMRGVPTVCFYAPDVDQLLVPSRSTAWSGPVADYPDDGSDTLLR